MNTVLPRQAGQVLCRAPDFAQAMQDCWVLFVDQIEVSTCARALVWSLFVGLQESTLVNASTKAHSGAHHCHALA
jgi:hypothetical protein